MPKLPAIQFYTGDWMKDPNVSKCSAATRGVWMDAICAMHESDRSGTLSGTADQLARVLRCSPSEVLAAARELSATGTADVTERNGSVTLINRRMQREYKLRQQARLRQGRKRGNGNVTPSSRSCHGNVTSPSSSSSSIATTTIPPPAVESALRKCGVSAKALVGAGGDELRRNAGSALQVFTAFEEIGRDQNVKSAVAVLITRLQSGPLPVVSLSAEHIVRLSKRWPVVEVKGEHVNGQGLKYTGGNKLVIGEKMVSVDGLRVEDVVFGG